MITNILKIIEHILFYFYCIHIKNYLIILFNLENKMIIYKKSLIIKLKCLLIK